MARVLFANYVRHVLTTAVLTGDTTLYIESTALLPTLGSGDWFYLVLIRLGDNVKEIVKCTAWSEETNTVTVTRAQEGTDAIALTVGDRVELWLTAGALADMRNEYAGAGAITSTQLATGAVTAAKIGSSAVTADKMATNAVTTVKITDANVTPAKLAAQLQTTLGVPAYTGQIAKLANGLVYVAHGLTVWDWTRVNSPIAANTGSAPLYAGQLCRDINGSWWIAIGTSSAADWLALCSDTLGLRKFDTAPAPPTGYGAIRINAAGALVFVPEGGGPEIDLTGEATAPVAAALAPDWDSGWTKIAPACRYSLAKSDAYDDPVAKTGGFSMTTGKANAGSGYGMTDANATFESVFDPPVSASGVPWRFAHLLIKPLNNPGDIVSYRVVPLFQISGNYGTEVNYHYAGGYYELVCGYTGPIYSGSGVVPNGWSLSYITGSGLVRMQAWK
jgi:hypothetical protein